MRNLLVKLFMVSLLGVCLVAPSTQANTGDAITGDGGGGNLDSSTFGDFFTVPGIPLDGFNAFSTSGLPSNWRCLNRAICDDCDLRLETLAKMLATNLSGTLTQQVIQGSAPRFCCDPAVAARAISFQDVALSKSPVPPLGEAFQMTSGSSGAALLAGVKPASLNNQLPSSGSVMVAQAVAPDAEPVRINPAPAAARPRKSYEPFPAANTSPSANQLNEELQQALNLQSDPIDPAKSQSIKLQSLQALVTTLQGLVWEESLPDQTQQINVDVEQLAAAIKSYNDLLSLMSVEELNAWRGNRNGQDITNVLKQLREGVTLL
jgi:hypothetical protein